MKSKLFFISTLFLANNGNGQENTTVVDEVVIQGKFLRSDVLESNFNIQVISKADIQDIPANTIEDLLQYVSGIDVRRRGANAAQTDVTIRGGSFEQVLILINGIRMNDSQTGHNSMTIPVDISSVDHIEIIKGPAARRYGQGAYSGVINIITKINNIDQVKINVEIGDFTTYSLGTTATFGNEKFKNLFSVNRAWSDGYRHNTDSEVLNIFYQNQFPISNGHVGLQAGFVEKKFGANGFYSSPLATEQYEETQASLVALKYEQKFNRWGISSNAFWRRGQDMYLYNRAKPEIYRNMHICNNYGLELNSTYQSSLGLSGFGAEFREEDLVSSNLGNRERKVVQLFIEHHFSFFNNRLKLTPGMSWANYSGLDNFFYPGLDLGYQLAEHHRFFGNIGRVNRLPSFTDLYYTSPTEIGNPNLTPENAWSSELGYQYKRNHSFLKLSLFLKNSKDAIDWTKTTTSDAWQAFNVGDITSKGFEVELQQSFPQFLKTRITINYTYLENDYKSTSQFSKYLIDNLKHQLIIRLQNKIGKYLTNEISYRYIDRVNSNSYHLLDEKLSLRLKNIEPYVLINNLSNTNYSETFGIPMAGRWFHFGVSFTIM